jgi:hypothetical protein
MNTRRVRNAIGIIIWLGVVTFILTPGALDHAFSFTSWGWDQLTSPVFTIDSLIINGKPFSLSSLEIFFMVAILLYHFSGLRRQQTDRTCIRQPVRAEQRARQNIGQASACVWPERSDSLRGDRTHASQSLRLSNHHTSMAPSLSRHPMFSSHTL